MSLLQDKISGKELARVRGKRFDRKKEKPDTALRSFYLRQNDPICFAIGNDDDLYVDLQYSRRIFRVKFRR